MTTIIEKKPLRAIDFNYPTLRVGTETRRVRFRDNTVDGYAFTGGSISTAGTWITRDWSRPEIAGWVRAYHRWERLRFNWVRRIFRVNRPCDFSISITNNFFA
jgi:hypothetical protein